MLRLAGPRGADLRHSLLSDVRLVLGDHLKTAMSIPRPTLKPPRRRKYLGPADEFHRSVIRFSVNFPPALLEGLAGAEAGGW